jgi:Alanine racemase, N-terminal domain
MSFVISIDTDAWRAHQQQVVDYVRDAGAELVPVAKGNGYGVGNSRLARETARLGLGVVACGTVHEAAGLLDATPDLDVLILEPLNLRTTIEAAAWRALAEHPGAGRIIHTISSPEGARDVGGLASPGRPRRVLLEGLTTMRRFGMVEDELAQAITLLAPHVSSGAITIAGLALHLPIATPERPRVGSMAMLSTSGSPPEPMVVGSARVHEVVAWGLLWPTLVSSLAHIQDAGSLWVSHLEDRECTEVRSALPDLPLKVRIGTRLWLGRRGALRASGRVLAVHATPSGVSAGYHQRRSPKGGHIVIVSGGTSHGVALTAPRPARSIRQRAAAAGDGALEAAGRLRSPFHVPGESVTWFQEPPHMHVSMLRLPHGTTPPEVGDLIDCDVRFTTVNPDVILG